MGTVTSKEHEETLHAFRAQLLSMLDMMLGYTTLQTTDISVRRIRSLHHQVKGLSLNMLQYFATKWVAECQGLVEDLVPDPDEQDVQAYVDKLVVLKIKLPNNGSGQDMHNMVVDLPHSQKKDIINLLQLVHGHATTAKSMSDAAKKQKKHKPHALLLEPDPLSK